jgi:hypothetical protein
MDVPTALTSQQCAAVSENGPVPRRISPPNSAFTCVGRPPFRRKHGSRVKARHARKSKFSRINLPRARLVPGNCRPARTVNSLGRRSAQASAMQRLPLCALDAESRSSLQSYIVALTCRANARAQHSPRGCPRPWSSHDPIQAHASSHYSRPRGPRGTRGEASHARTPASECCARAFARHVGGLRFYAAVALERRLNASGRNTPRGVAECRSAAARPTSSRCSAEISAPSARSRARARSRRPRA